MKNKTLIDRGLELPLMEAFYTIQGEGYHTGTAAYFIRVGGCDVGCHWCDVKESWNPNLHPATAIEKIVDDARPYGKTIVITGGEPLMWDMSPLTQMLKSDGFSIHLETSGAYPLSGHFDWICLSPKKTMPPLPQIYETAHELKIIIYNNHDFVWAEQHAEKVGPKCVLYLQPEWSKREKMMPQISDYVMKNPKWRISLQTHKYIGIP